MQTEAVDANPLKRAYPYTSDQVNQVPQRLPPVTKQVRPYIHTQKHKHVNTQTHKQTHTYFLRFFILAAFPWQMFDCLLIRWPFMGGYALNFTVCGVKRSIR